MCDTIQFIGTVCKRADMTEGRLSYLQGFQTFSLFTQHESHTGHQVNALRRQGSFKCSVSLISLLQTGQINLITCTQTAKYSFNLSHAVSAQPGRNTHTCWYLIINFKVQFTSLLFCLIRNSLVHESINVINRYF